MSFLSKSRLEQLFSLILQLNINHNTNNMKKTILLLWVVFASITAWAAEGYAVFTPNNTTLTFYYGDKPEGAYSLNELGGNPSWYSDGTNTKVTKVVFDSSFAEARPTNFAYWFYKMENLTSIIGLNYLNTSMVRVMEGMFRECSKLTTLDLSSFNTENVRNMQFMFYKCSELTSLNLSSFNTSNVSTLSQMFFGCSKLTSLDLSSFNTSKLKYMAFLFNDCSSLTSLDLSSFDTSNVTDMTAMFANCSSLTSLDVSHFNTSKVTSMHAMFSECKNLSTLDVSNFNTSNVTSMQWMFRGCNNLITLDLRNFNTSNVTNMKGMFRICSNLKTIYAGYGWSTTSVTDSNDMFQNCTSLVGGAGTTYSSAHTNADYAHIDGGPSNPGYFTAKGGFENYDLWINGEQVTNANCGNLSTIDGVSGSVTYNPSSNTLTLNNATLSNDGVTNGCCIKSEIDGLTVNLIGNNSLSAQTGIKACGMDVNTTTINGTGTLSAQAKLAGIQTHSGKTLTIDNVTDLSATSSKYGIFASSPSNSCIVIKGSKTVVHANGSSGTIRNFDSFVLEDGLAITEPTGGYYSDGLLRDADGNIATQATISKLGGILGDIDGNNMIDVEDVNAAINIILKLKTINDYPGNGDMDNNGYIDVEDVNAMINIILKL